ncbi:hypothetical protein ACFLQY_05835, partial [Verrucomicrobiota bacterium]
MLSGVALGVPVSIPTPGGPIVLDLSHAGPAGQLVEPEPPSDAGFRPPTIFSAPLPVGSGARALGQGGAFTAVADDATAASWNPAGLPQLETAELSLVYRCAGREDRYDSRTADLEAGVDDYSSSEFNYLSAVYPFLLNDHNAVVSFNYQEAYDFTQEFSARFSGGGAQEVDTLIEQTFTDTVTNRFVNPSQDITVISRVVTDTHSRIEQVLNSSLLSGIDFRQAGTIDAVSPAFALELTPKFSVGMTVNLYTDGASRGNPIESVMVAEYAGTSDSAANVADTRNSTAEISWDGVWYDGPTANPVSNPVSGTQTNYLSDADTNVQQDLYAVDGLYRETNRTDDFHGVNATFGALWSANEKLQLGASLDLPWTGEGTQTKRIEHREKVFDSGGTLIGETFSQETRVSDVEYTFPLYWSVGALWRWSDRLYSSLDVSRTDWSDFSYKAEGEERINPLNGEPHASSSLDDCWSVRLGSEYLCMLSWTEIPLRGGVFWEQRPAVGAPDEYCGFSLGSGVSVGKGSRKVILDAAYVFECADDVMGSLLPEQAVTADSTKHQLYLSAIW